MVWLPGFISVLFQDLHVVSLLVRFSHSLICSYADCSLLESPYLDLSCRFVKTDEACGFSFLCYDYN